MRFPCATSVVENCRTSTPLARAVSELMRAMIRPGSGPDADGGRLGERGANASASAMRSSTSTWSAFTCSWASSLGEICTRPLASSDVVPAAAVKRSRFICALESDERAETVICRPRLASVTFCSVIARTDTICRPPVVEGSAGLPPGAGNVNGSGMSMRLSETATSASSMRRDHSGFSPVETCTSARKMRTGSPARTPRRVIAGLGKMRAPALLMVTGWPSHFVASRSSAMRTPSLFRNQ